MIDGCLSCGRKVDSIHPVADKAPMIDPPFTLSEANAPNYIHKLNYVNNTLNWIISCRTTSLLLLDVHVVLHEAPIQ